MKTYHTPDGLRMVGKGYEIRWQLQRLMESAKHPHEPLTARLSDWKAGDRKVSGSAQIVPFPIWRTR